MASMYFYSGMGLIAAILISNNENTYVTNALLFVAICCFIADAINRNVIKYDNLITFNEK